MNAGHPDRNAFERFSRGEASAAEERWIEDHLRSACALCQEHVDELLSCSFDPSGAALEETGGQDADLADDLTASQDAAWDRLFARLGSRLSRAAAERNDAPALLGELFGRPWEEQSVLLRLDRRLRTVAVCEQLIETSFEEGFRDPSRAIELAERGLLLAELLDAERYGRSVVQDLQARAWAYLGNARRIAFDLAGAEAALIRAERLVEEGSADPLEEARVLDLRASLLSDQGHFEQAAELLEVVIDIYGDLGEPHRKGRAMISKGVFLGYSGWPEEAIRQIRKGLGLIDWDREPRLVLMARHNLAWFLNDCGRSEEALRQLERFRHTYREFSDAWTALRLAWLDGRIAGGLGRVEDAERILREVRRSFLAGGQGYDAALVTLDLAHLHLENGRAAEVRTLARELLDLFLSHDIHRQALAALAVFQTAVDMDDATPGLAQAVSSYLVRARRNPQLRFEKAAA
jgi:tetratricopeptide (TPR) repeat protein